MRKKIGRNRKKTVESYRANCRVSKELWEEITFISREMGLDCSSVVRMLITTGVRAIRVK